MTQLLLTLVTMALIDPVLAMPVGLQSLEYASFVQRGASSMTNTVNDAADGRQDLQNLRLLKTGDQHEKMRAAKYFGEKKKAAAVPELIKALNDRDQYVRGAAALALSEIGDRSAITPILKAFEKYDRLWPTDHSQQQTKCLSDFYLALEKLTGQKLGLDLEKWQQYWRDHCREP